MDLPAEGLLTRQQAEEIELLAEGLTENEVSLYIWGKEFAELDEALQPDFRRHYTRGRTRFKIYAVNALKIQMNGRNGLQASLAALTRFAEAWPTVQNEGGSGNFNFNINLADD